MGKQVNLQGSGKTFTMIGDKKNPGLYYLATKDVFSIINNNQDLRLSIQASYFEIYCGKLFDLLNSRKKLQVREDAKQNINIVGLKKFNVNSPDQLFEMISVGNSIRITSTTGKNTDSSRSHAIMQLYVMLNGKQEGILSFIDLAGNERGADTYAHDIQTRIDGAEISKSLLALKECIRALDQDKKHIPFRGSKLTMVLKDSFIGKCKTIMLCTIAPTLENCEYTLNTLRYADRVKELKRDSREKIPSNNELLLPRHAGNIRKYDIKDLEKEEKYKKPEDFSEMKKRGSSAKKGKRSRSSSADPKRAYDIASDKKPPLLIRPKNKNDQESSNNNSVYSSPQLEISSKHNLSDIKLKKKLVPAYSISNDELKDDEIKHNALINRIISQEEQLIKKHWNHLHLMESSSEVVFL